MTTIAYHHESKKISVDSRVCAGNIIVCDDFIKIYQMNEGMLIGAGAVDCIGKLIDSVNENKVECDCDASAILITNKAVFSIGSDNGKIYKQKLEYNYTLGTGGEYASAAMDFKCSSAEAVRYAITKDSLSGGIVRTLCVKSGAITTE